MSLKCRLTLSRGLRALSRSCSTVRRTQMTQKYKKYIYRGAGASPQELFQNHIVDTSIWSTLGGVLSDDDIMVSTPGKAGSTWTHEIIWQLLLNGEHAAILGTETGHENSIWAAMCMVPEQAKLSMMERQSQNPLIPRRVLKSHEAVETMPFRESMKYIFVGRDYRDIVWSLYNHQSLMMETVTARWNEDKEYAFKKRPRFNFKDGSHSEMDLWRMMLSEGDDHGNPDGFPVCE